MYSPSANSLDHVAIAVYSIEESSSLFELLTGESCSSPTIVEAQGVSVAFVGTIELIEPLGPDTSVGRFLARRGPGLHHIAFRTPDIESELDRLDAAGLQLIHRTPQPGAHGLIAFIHPSSTGGVLVELVQRGR